MGSLLGTAVKNRRKELHWRVYELANKAGVEPEFITQIEKGRRLPSELVLVKIIQALGIDLKPHYYTDKHPGIASYLKRDIVVKLKSGRTVAIDVKAKSKKAP